MTTPGDNPDNQRTHLLGTIRGGLVLCDGPRKIEIGTHRRTIEGGVEIVLYAGSLHRWDYPHQDDPLTEPIKEDILQKTSELLQSRDSRVKVTIKR